jgi:F420-0:gamma-glutamyl ligase
MVDLIDIPSLDGADNMPGTATEIAVIAKRDIETFGTPASGDVVINTAHILKSGKGFTKIYNTLESGELMSESKGGIDGRYQGQNYKGFIPGLRPEVMKNLRIAQNTEMLVIITDSNGRKLQIGSKEYPA